MSDPLEPGPDDRHRRHDRGQATVELALVLPLVLVLALGLLQVTLVVRDQLAVDLAAREGARAAAVSATPAEAAAAAVSRVLPAGQATVHTSASGSDVTVQVSAPVSVALPVVGAVVGGRELTGRATMAIEPPADP